MHKWIQCSKKLVKHSTLLLKQLELIIFKNLFQIIDKIKKIFKKMPLIILKNIFKI